MLLAHDVERFYRIWFPLLHYANQQRHLVASFPDHPGVARIHPQEVLPLRDALWADDTLREGFIADNPARLSADDLALVAIW